MFLLKRREGNDHVLLQGKNYSLGRKGCDILLENDQSISRKHAIIKITAEGVFLEDCASKYGTFHKGKKIAPNVDNRIEDTDEIKFGIYGTVFNLEKRTIITTGSGLNTNQKAELKTLVGSLGGTVINNWNDNCTHLTLEQIVLTVKVLHAVIDYKPLVTFQFWREFAKNVEKGLPPPNVEKFEPTIAEAVLKQKSISPNPQRRTLFKGKTFVFHTNKIMNSMSEIIAKAGGNSTVWTPQLLLNDSHIFIQIDEQNSVNSHLNSALLKLKQQGKRVIPIQEIALAIMACSCEKHCNPGFNRVEQVFTKTSSESQSQQFILAPETEEESQRSISDTKQIIIPCTPEVSTNALILKKTALGNGNEMAKRKSCDVLESPVKKIKMDIVEESRSKKRKASSQNVLNPFAVMAPPKTTNIVGSLTKTRERLCDNPFAKKTSQVETIKIEETEVKEVEIAENSLRKFDETPFSHSISSINLTWLSKSTIKSEPPPIDDDLKPLYDRFRNCVQIQVVPQLIIKPILQISQTQNSFSVKNFKKFVKKAPLHPQTEIIYLQQTVNMTMANNTVDVESEESDREELEVPQPVFTQNKKARFDF